MLRTLAALLLLSVPAAAAAQVREQPIDEVAADLAYGFCPLFLAGQFSLTGPELAQRGFGKTVVPYWTKIIDLYSQLGNSALQK